MPGRVVRVITAPLSLKVRGRRLTYSLRRCLSSSYKAKLVVERKEAKKVEITH
jgi:hypothetical protein